MKFALLYAGPYRGTDEILDNHIKVFGSDIDIYVSCFEHYLDDWKKSDWPVKEYFITPDIDFKSTNWYKYRNNEAGQSGFWQFWNLKSVIDNVPKIYDYYIKCRNDIVFNKTFEFDKSSLKSNTLYSPNKSFHKVDWDITQWINDEFYMACDYTMLVISKFVTDFYNNENRHPINSATASNESQLRIHLKENNIIVEKIYEFPYQKNHYGVTQPSGYVKFQLENIQND
jgi:hypothetical protein